MNGRSIGVTVWNECAGNGYDAIAWLGKTEFKSKLLSESEELVGVLEFVVDDVWSNAFDRAKLLGSLENRSDGKNRSSWEVLAYLHSSVAVSGRANDKSCIGGFCSLNSAAAYSLGDVSLNNALFFDVETYENVRIGAFADGSHGLNGFLWILTLCRFAGKHDCIGTVENCVCNVACFGAGWTWVLLHGLKHLSCGNNELASLVALSDDHLLSEDNVLEWNFNAHVAAGNHDAVGYFEDFIEIIQAFLVFDLGDDLDVFAAVLVEELTDTENVFLLADEGCSDKVNFAFAAETEIDFILFSERWKGGDDVWKVNALVFAENARVLNFGDDLVAFDFDNAKTDETVVEENGIACLEVLVEVFVSYGNFGLVAENGLVSGKGESLTSFEGNVFAVNEVVGTDFRTLGVEEDCADLLLFGHEGAEVDHSSAVFPEIAVGEVKAHNVHARVEELGHHWLVFGLWSDGAYDLRLFHTVLRSGACGAPNPPPIA